MADYNNAQSTVRPRNLKTVFPLWKHIKCFSVPAQYARKIYKSNNTGHAGLDENSGRKIICLSCYDRSKSSVWRGLFVIVQMFFINIFPYLNCFNLFETNVTQ